ncbi:DUF5667 domain-containing protein [Streptomyces laurentii]|uniref:DUF5667 domain-containing protein n=1 Tax=Streptomyces laurentii TaxID=39478 RepID=UPI00369BBC39
MIANVSTHRRANAFAQALEDRTSEGATAERSEASAESAERGRLLALANGLGTLPRPEMDPEVKVVQRAQLVAAMEAMLAEGNAAAGPTVPGQRGSAKGVHRASPLRKLRPRSRWTKGLAAGGLTVGVAAGALSGVAAASSDALPGDSLYGLKRGMEDIKRGMADDDADRGGIYLDQASTRLNEARRLMERGRSGDLDHESVGEIRRVLGGMTHDAAEGHRLLRQAYQRDGEIEPMARLNSFAQSHRATWDGLRDRLPVQLTDVSKEVNDVFAAIDQDVQPLQSLLPRPPERGPVGSSGPNTPGATPTATPQRSHSSSATPSRGGDSAQPTPSGSGTGTKSGAPEDGGLLGGAGDLLNPPQQTGPSSSPSGKESTPAAPDVTLPPLLPGLLPGLGIDSGNAD